MLSQSQRIRASLRVRDPKDQCLDLTMDVFEHRGCEKFASLQDSPGSAQEFFIMREMEDEKYMRQRIFPDVATSIPTFFLDAFQPVIRCFNIRPKEFAHPFCFKSTLPDYPEEETHSVSIETYTHIAQSEENPTPPWFSLTAPGGIAPNGTTYSVVNWNQDNTPMTISLSFNGLTRNAIVWYEQVDDGIVSFQFFLDLTPRQQAAHKPMLDMLHRRWAEEMPWAAESRIQRIRDDEDAQADTCA